MWRHNPLWMGFLYDKARCDYLTVVHCRPECTTYHFDQFVHNTADVLRIGMIHAVVKWRGSCVPTILGMIKLKQTLDVAGSEQREDHEPFAVELCLKFGIQEQWLLRGFRRS